MSASIEGSISPAVSLLGPFNLAKAVPAGGSAGSFTAAFGASFDQTRTNASDYKIYVDLNNLAKSKQDDGWESIVGDVDCKSPNRNSSGTYLEGNLGLTAWLKPTFVTQEGTRRYAPPPLTPIVSGLSSSSVPVGKDVTIKGKYFTGVTTVLFGDVVAKFDQSTATDTMIDATVPEPQNGKNAVHVTVTAAGGTSAAGPHDVFKYQVPKAAEASVSSATPSAPSSGNQLPTIGSTFTFTIKSTGSVGPSFVLTRVSGGGGALFSLTRTDTNYVNIVLTPTSYCSVAGQTCTKNAGGVEAAQDRLESTLATLNLNRALTPGVIIP